MTDTRRLVEILCRNDNTFREFAARTLGATTADDAWEMLYSPGGISKMSPEQSETSVPQPIQPPKPPKPPSPVTPKKYSGTLKPQTPITPSDKKAKGNLKPTGKSKTKQEQEEKGKPPNNKVEKSRDSEFSIVKSNDDKRQVFGWASVIEKNGQPVLDKQGDVIEADEMEKSAYRFVINSRKGGQQHRRDERDEPLHVSDMIESFALTPEKKEAMGLPDDTPTGWWVGFQVNDPSTWSDVKNGKVTSFSIHGKGRRVPME